MYILGVPKDAQILLKRYSTPNEDLPYFTLVSVSPPCVSPSHGGFMVTATVNSR